MRKNFFWIVLMLIVCTMPMKMSGQTYDRLWKQVEEAQKKSLPQTAIKVTQQIFTKAQAEKNTPQMLKAYTAWALYRSEVTPDSFYVDLRGLEEWAATEHDHVDCAVLHTVIAMAYAEYGLNNSWQLRQRTDIVGEAPEDIREWSAIQFVEKVLDHTYAALDDSTLLLNTSSKDYQPFVVLGDASGYYGHDLYHLLGKTGVESLTKVRSLDEGDRIKSSIRTIFDRLTRTYRERGNADAYILVTIDRLKNSALNNSQDDVLAGLNKLISEYGNTDVVAEAYLEKAKILNNKGLKVEAMQVADEAIRKYPRYNRINALNEIRDNIQNPFLRVWMEDLLYPDMDYKINVMHANLDGFTVEYHLVNLPASSPLVQEYYNKDTLRKYARKVSSQHVGLVRPADYIQKDTIITLQARAEGLYLVRIIPDVQKEQVTERLLSVSRLRLLSRELPDKQFEVVVLDGKSGLPVQDAQVRIYANNRGERQEVKVLTTDAEGKALTPWDDKFRFIVAEKGTDKFMRVRDIIRGYYYYTEPSKIAKQTSVNLLTDRSLYRPGQTVYVKGIAYDMASDTANVIPNRTYTLRLSDPNMREIFKKTVSTNEFGSFTAEIVLPSAGLNGMYYLSTEQGTTSIRVEEYKRPTFDITFEPLDGTYRLGDQVAVRGSVKSFSGVSLQDVPVTYTVNRSMRGWWGRYFEPPTLIDSGTAQVNDSGEFSIPVTLKTDEKQKTDEGFYQYTITATVTNVAGETQTSETVLAAGSRSLLLSVNIADKIDKNDTIKVTFGATNLSGRPVEVEGEYKIYPITDYMNRVVATDPVFTGTFKSNTETIMSAWQSLPSGAYRIKTTAKDQMGREATGEGDFVLFSLNDTRPPVQTPIWYHPINTQFDQSHPASFIFGTSEKDAYILMDVFSGNRRIESKVLHLSDSLMRFEYPYQASYADGINIMFGFIKDNQFYQQNVPIVKRPANKELTMKWEVFRDKLRPGQQEEWRLTIQRPDGMPADAEMLATMYDASLDKIWRSDQGIRLYYNTSLPMTSWMTYGPQNNSYWIGFTGKNWKYPALDYDTFWHGSTLVNIYYSMDQMRPTPRANDMLQKSMMTRAAGTIMATEDLGEAVQLESALIPVAMETGTSELDSAYDPETVELRTNFAETAFFYPQLRTNEKGEIVLSFTVPESLTRWNFRGYAHTKGMLTGMLNGEVTTSKEFMVTPNLPRFVRVGDKTSVAASITNTTGTAVSGTAVFTLFDPLTDKVISTQKQKFTAEAGKSTGVSFSFTADDKYEILGCRIVAEGNRFSDGEQHMLPVLSDKERITESISLSVRGNETREFSLETLFNNNSKTATDRKLTLEFSANPAWYAIQALPSVSMPDNDNAISWASAYYANSLASYILNAQPRIKTIFDTWKIQGGDKETFLSNLQKNQDVKNILLEESPWVMEATSEAEQMQRIGTLFDLNNLNNNNIAAITKLKDLQLTSGAWTWYKGMNGSRYITMYVLETLVRLNDLTDNAPEQDVISMRSAAFTYLHNEAVSEYNRIREAEKKGSKFTGISSEALEYLYLVAISGEKVPSSASSAYNYFLNKLPESITRLSVREKALSAIVLSRAGKATQAAAFMASLKEHLVRTDNQGMHFAFNESPYRWDNLRIPAHVAAMEAFDIAANDPDTVEEMKIWLLGQKRTQQWDSPVSTVNAVYALLHRGTNLLENQGDVRITLGNKVIDPASSQGTIPGTGYIKQTFTEKNVVNKPGKVTVEKRDSGLAWGAVYAQYSEDIDKVNRHGGGGLSVDKKLYVEKVEGTTKQLVLLTSGTELKVGNRVVSRVTITLDQAMDFVQLKDQRGACFEPEGALSGYRWNNGFGYYVAVKDASTNFFFDALGKGVYVIEYSYRVSRAGTYQAGLAIIQSAYAPEYSSNSASQRVSPTN